MYRENAPQNPSDLLVLQPNAAGFLADADRFHSDTAGEEYLERKAKYERKQDIFNTTRQRRAAAEEERWKKIEEGLIQEFFHQLPVLPFSYHISFVNLPSKMN